MIFNRKFRYCVGGRGHCQELLSDWNSSTDRFLFSFSSSVSVDILLSQVLLGKSNLRAPKILLLLKRSRPYLFVKWWLHGQMLWGKKNKKTRHVCVFLTRHAVRFFWIMKVLFSEIKAELCDDVMDRSKPQKRNVLLNRKTVSEKNSVAPCLQHCNSKMF